MKKIVIGIEGLVGSGKTSICRDLLKKNENSVLLNGGNLYRAIVYALINSKKDADKLKDELINVDIKSIMDRLKLEIKIENNETIFYINNKKMAEEDLQSKESSIAVSKIGGVADNSHLFEFARNLIDNLKKNYDVIVSGRSIMEIYPNIDYHFFITASLEERVRRKYIQYNEKVTKEELEEHIRQRDSLQEKAGFYKISPKTIVIDVTKCKCIEESSKKILEHINVYNNNM